MASHRGGDFASPAPLAQTQLGTAPNSFCCRLFCCLAFSSPQSLQRLLLSLFIRWRSLSISGEHGTARSRRRRLSDWFGNNFATTPSIVRLESGPSSTSERFELAATSRLRRHRNIVAGNDCEKPKLLACPYESWNFAQGPRG